MHLGRFTTIFSVLLMLSIVTQAADEAKKKKRKRGPAAAFRVPKGIELDEGQKEKLAALRREYTPKLEDLLAKADAILTDEQKKARAEAAKAAKEAGKKGKEAREEIEATIKLSDEQKEKLIESRKTIGALRKEIQQKLLGLLTDEQKANIPKKKKRKDDS